LFHNGITIIAKDVKATKDKVTISGYYVVNGCQSLSELFNNSPSLTDNLRVLVKLIKMEASSPLSEMVTSFSNNQNGVKARDFKSNNPIQIRLQNEFKKSFRNEFYYEIKRGDDNAGLQTITNEQAGLYLMAFDLKRPWATHRKYQVFEDDHSEIFGRPSVTAERIVFLHLLSERIDAMIPRLQNSLFAKYALTRFLLMYIARLILDADAVGANAVANPNIYVSDKRNRRAFLRCADQILNDIVIDLNAELDQLGADFDYRGKLRDEVWVKDLAARLVGDYRKLVSRGRIDSFEVEFKKAKGPPPAKRAVR
jgi:hypothetical protein